MTIQPFTPSDLTELESFNFFSALQLRHHDGLKPENAFSAWEDNKLLGTGFFVLPTLGNPKGLRKAELTLVARPDLSPELADEARSRLLDAVLARYRTVRAAHPETNLILRICTETSDLAGMAFHLGKGAALENLIPVLAYDLTQLDEARPSMALPDGSRPLTALPEGIRIEPLQLNDEGFAAYLHADLEASDVPDNETEMRFRSGNPSFLCFVALHGEEVVGSASVWDMGEERAATENIFVVPAFRKKGLATALIETAWSELRSRGKKVATLSVMGTNLPALALYQRIGSKLVFNLIEIVYR